MKRTISCAGAALLLLLLTARASADPSGGPAMPISIDPARMSTDTILVRNVPFADPELGYEIAVPATWADETAMPAARESWFEPVALGTWRDVGPGEHAELVVSCLVPPYPMPAQAWVELTARAQGWEVLRRQLGKTEVGDVADVLARTGSWIRRRAAFLDGDRIFLVDGAAPEAQYAEFADFFAAAIVSFRLRQRVSLPKLDSVPVELERPLPVRISHPAGWRVETGTGLPEGHAVLHLRPPAGSESGIFLRFHLAGSAAALDEQAAGDLALEVARADGFVPRDAIVRQACEFPGFPKGRFLFLSGAGRELRIFTLECPQGRLTLSALGPGREVSRSAWRLCRTALETLIADVAPLRK